MTQIDRVFLEARLGELQQQHLSAIRQLAAVDGAIQVVEQLLAVVDALEPVMNQVPANDNGRVGANVISEEPIRKNDDARHR